MRVAIIADSGKTRLAQIDPHSRLQSELTRNAVLDALVELGHDVETIEVGPNLLNKIEDAHPDAMFNIASGYNSKKQQSNVVAMLELTDIPFTGSGTKTHVLAMYKDIAKVLLRAKGIPTPRFMVFHSAKELDLLPCDKELPIPVIVKPSAEGSSIGIHSDSVTFSVERVRQLVLGLFKTVGPPVIVEEFVPGREFTVALVGYPEPTVLPIEEILFNEEVFYTYEVKAADNVTTVCPAEIPLGLACDIQYMAVEAFGTIGCRDIARVDLRVSEEGFPYVLEINTLPGLTPGYSEVPRIAEKANIGYAKLIGLILDGALKRGEIGKTEQFEDMARD